jgi:NTE family protein
MEIALALGGGGAKGNAHLGILRCLDRHGFKINAIAGTSSGGAYGAFYAAGYSPQEVIERLSHTDQSNLFGREPGDGPSLMGFAGLSHILSEFLGERTFEQLQIPFAVTAVDVNSGRQVILREGRVIDALLATMAIPGIFPPRQWDGHLLIDGGVLDNVPVRLVRSLAPKLPVVAVALSKPIEEMEHVISPLEKIPPNPILIQISRLRVAQALKIFLDSLEISSNQLVELRLRIDRPDVIIRPELSHIGLLDHVDIANVAQIGEESAEKAIPALENAVNSRRNFFRFVRRLFRLEKQPK